MGQIRRNAGNLVRLKNEKVGCTLCVHMGYCNHDCDPNCEIKIDDEGFVNVLTSKETGIPKGEELTISYVNQNDPERRTLLKNHYMFECLCQLCVEEKRNEMKRKNKIRRKTHVMANNKGEGWEFKTNWREE